MRSGPAGGLPPSRVGNADPATIDPRDSAPGLAATSDALLQAFAYTSNIVIRDMGTDDIQDLIKVTEIAVPPGSDYRNRSPKTAPFPVVSDENVAVTATLLSHYDVYPAFGFRFDLTKSGVSVTFSSDTTKSDEVITLAKDTDILVHEAQFSLEDGYYHNKFPPKYLVNSHTSAEQVGEVAAAANAKHLVLKAPGNPQMAAASRRFWSERLGLDRTILWRAHNRGEIDATTQHRPVIEALLGPLYFRLLVTGEPLDDRFIEGIVDLVCAACTVN